MATPPPFTILLVDDEPVVTETMKLFLEEGIARAHVETAGSAEEGLEKLRRQPFDMVITDDQLPGRKGTELLGDLARTSPHTLRVLLTGTIDPTLAAGATVGPGIHGYIQKPYAPRRVVALVRELLYARNDERPRVQQRVILEAMGRSRTSRWRSAPADDPVGEPVAEARNDQDPAP
ncbi:MAG TPA: response regulator [Candidatus Thermoplasmatota archaeon]|jgi:DNA-binding NtrC family response regulator|nr:response regulator [Candidatus Thermoplasmatota archaeon]